MAETVIGTYNMSFASDKGLLIGSEKSFLLRNKNQDGRAFWKNALAHLESFINIKKPLAVGLHEMNKTDNGTDTGSDAINNMLVNTIYKQYVDEIVVDENQKPALSIILDTERTGDELNYKFIDNKKQFGRPIMMILTEKDNKKFLFVNMHGAQDPKLGKFEDDFNNYMIDYNKNFLQAQVTEFLGDIVPDHIYIMGDFNDRYDAIKELKFGDMTATYAGDSPAACCHNWDSMGTKGQRDPIQMKNKNLEGSTPTLEALNANLSTKVQGKTSITIDGNENETETKTEIQGAVLIPSEHGITVGDYINKGDKVFASTPGPLAIYNYDEIKDKPSDRSDHELVYMTIGGTSAEQADADAVANKFTEDVMKKSIEKTVDANTTPSESSNSMEQTTNNGTGTDQVETKIDPVEERPVQDAEAEAPATEQAADDTAAPATEQAADDTAAPEQAADDAAEIHNDALRVRAILNDSALKGIVPKEPTEGGKAKSRKGRRTKKGKKGNRKTKKSRKSKRSKRSKKSKK